MNRQQHLIFSQRNCIFWTLQNIPTIVLSENASSGIGIHNSNYIIMVSMTRDDFRREWEYGVKTEFQRDGVRAAWAEDHPKYWGQEDYRLWATDAEMSAIAVSPDECFLALGAGRRIRIYRLEDPPHEVEVLIGHIGGTDHLKFSPTRSLIDGDRAIYTLLSSSKGKTAAESSTVLIWNLSGDGQNVERDTLSSLNVLHLAQKATEAVVRGLEESGKGVANNDSLDTELADLTDRFEEALLWMPAIKRSMQGKQIVLDGRPAGFKTVMFSPDGHLIAYLIDDKSSQQERRQTSVVVYEIATRSEKFRISGHTDSIVWTGFSPDGKLLASSCWDQTIKLYDVESGTIRHQFGPTGGQNWAGCFSADSTLLTVSRGSPSTEVYVWDTRDGSLQSTFTGIKHWARSLTFSPCGKHIAAGGGYGKLCIYDPISGSLENEFELESGARTRSWLEIRDVTYFDGGTRLVWRNGTENGVEIYDLLKNERMRFSPRRTDASANCFANPSLTVCETRRLLVCLDGDGSVRIWKLAH